MGGVTGNHSLDDIVILVAPIDLLTWKNMPEFSHCSATGDISMRHGCRLLVAVHVDTCILREVDISAPELNAIRNDECQIPRNLEGYSHSQVIGFNPGILRERVLENTLNLIPVFRLHLPFLCPHYLSVNMCLCMNHAESMNI